MSHLALLPGAKMPSKTFALAGGGETDILSVKPGAIAKLIVVYRGQFCPFCEGTIKKLASKAGELSAAKFDVLLISADPVDVTKTYLAKNHEGAVPFDVACGLDEQFMHTLGVYVSDPKHYQPQTFAFSEPAYFVLDPQGLIKYRDGLSRHTLWEHDRT